MYKKNNSWYCWFWKIKRDDIKGTWEEDGQKFSIYNINVWQGVKVGGTYTTYLGLQEITYKCNDDGSSIEKKIDITTKKICQNWIDQMLWYLNTILSKYKLNFDQILNYNKGVDGFIIDVQTQITHWDYWDKTQQMQDDLDAFDYYYEEYKILKYNYDKLN